MMQQKTSYKQLDRLGLLQQEIEIAKNALDNLLSCLHSEIENEDLENLLESQARIQACVSDLDDIGWKVKQKIDSTRNSEKR